MKTKLTNDQYKDLVLFVEEFFNAELDGIDMPKWKYVKKLWEEKE